MRRRPPRRVSAATALLLEALVDYPAGLERRLGHPVSWIGGVLSASERAWNRPGRPPALRRALGVLAVAGPALTAALLGALAERAAPVDGGAPLLLAALALPGLAQRSLYQHVQAVRRALDRGDLPGARAAVARIVGRDTAAMDEAQVAAAALESLAESFNDGVVAPALWLALAGLPGLWAYKAVNTADSLIGHMEPRFRAFGWAAARGDDLMNLVPARAAGALLAIAGGGGWRTMLRDAPRHASPNAGWPEAALAGALKVRLGGPVCYDGQAARRPWFGDGPSPGAGDLARGLDVYVRACVLLGAALAAGEMLALGTTSARRRR